MADTMSEVKMAMSHVLGLLALLTVLIWLFVKLFELLTPKKPVSRTFSRWLRGVRLNQPTIFSEVDREWNNFARELTSEVPYFSGKKDSAAAFEEFEKIVQSHIHLIPVDAQFVYIAHLLRKISGPARLHLEEKCFYTIAGLLDVLGKRYKRRRSYEIARDNLKSARIMDDEDVEDFIMRISSLYNVALKAGESSGNSEEAFSKNDLNQLAIDQILAEVPNTYGELIVTASCKTIQQVIQAVIDKIRYERERNSTLQEI